MTSPDHEVEPDEAGTPTSFEDPGAAATAAPAAPGAGTDEAEPVEAVEEPAESEHDRVARELADRTTDLQRLQAEYLNYKRRVDRDREGVRDNAVASVLTALLPVLDDIGRAREHGELAGGFKAVGESLEQVVRGLGVEAFGTAGEEFDPMVHEALMYDTSAEVETPTADAVLQVGYRLGEKVLRPARVSVVAPAE